MIQRSGSYLPPASLILYTWLLKNSTKIYFYLCTTKRRLFTISVAEAQKFVFLDDSSSGRRFCHLIFQEYAHPSSIRLQYTTGEKLKSVASFLIKLGRKKSKLFYYSFFIILFKEQKRKEKKNATKLTIHLGQLQPSEETKQA